MNTHAPGWPLLVSVSARAVDWTGVLGAVGLALAVATLTTVLPARADAVLGTAAALVLACGLAAVLDDDTHDTTAPAPTSPRRRLAARAAVAVPILAAGLAGVVALLAGAGTGSQRDLIGTSAALAVPALAIAAVGTRGRENLPGPAAAAALLAPAAVLVPLLPAGVLSVPLWDSTPERIVLSGAVLLVATRDPVLPPVARWGRRPARGSRTRACNGSVSGGPCSPEDIRCFHGPLAGADPG